MFKNSKCVGLFAPMMMLGADDDARFRSAAASAKESQQ
jgi:hypothetical protein